MGRGVYFLRDYRRAETETRDARREQTTPCAAVLNFCRTWRSGARWISLLFPTPWSLLRVSSPRAFDTERSQVFGLAVVEIVLN
jgi:hypothetical protein